uniref:Uncharacterized protein n=1 Tax=Arundo donax TaxID=35708 RepID=A0A0A9F2A9_ARUDO
MWISKISIWQRTYAHISWSINTSYFSTRNKHSYNAKQPGSLH